MRICFSKLIGTFRATVVILNSRVPSGTPIIDLQRCFGLFGLSILGTVPFQCCLFSSIESSVHVGCYLLILSTIQIYWIQSTGIMAIKGWSTYLVSPCSYGLGGHGTMARRCGGTIAEAASADSDHRGVNSDNF